MAASNEKKDKEETRVPFEDTPPNDLKSPTRLHLL
jgi:hypothetical protein